MLKTITVAARDRARLAEILSVMGRYGLTVLLMRMGLSSEPDAAQQQGKGALSLPARTRLAMEELGPTFVKLGQILATRGDLLTPDWIAELEQLHSSAPTFPFEALRPAVEEALGGPPEEIFAAFDPEPLAAASMAQVHRARLENGREVVLKIRRPGIRPRIEADLRLIAQLAALVESASAEARRFTPQATMRQLAEAMLEELDFTNEGRNADRLRSDFEDDPRIFVPEIHWRYSSETLLVMDYIGGVPPRSAQALEAAGIDPAAIAEAGADAVLDMILINGRFHADPHPGNLLCLPGNRIALIDLGMIGHVSPRRREEILGFVQSLASGDPAALASTLHIWSQGGGASPEAIQRAAEKLIAKQGGARLVLSAVIADFFPLLREERLTMPSDLLLIFKALVTIDGVLNMIQPDFDLSGAIGRVWPRLMRARFAPENWTPVAQALLFGLSRLGGNAPHLLRAIKEKIETPIVPPAPDPAIAQAVRQAGWRISIALILAALLVLLGLFLDGRFA